MNFEVENKLTERIFGVILVCPWDDLEMTLACLFSVFILAGLLLPLLLNFGLFEFVGTLLTKVMRPLFPVWLMVRWSPPNKIPGL